MSTEENEPRSLIVNVAASILRLPRHPHFRICWLEDCWHDRHLMVLFLLLSNPLILWFLEFSGAGMMAESDVHPILSHILLGIDLNRTIIVRPYPELTQQNVSEDNDVQPGVFRVQWNSTTAFSLRYFLESQSGNVTSEESVVVIYRDNQQLGFILQKKDFESFEVGVPQGPKSSSLRTPARPCVYACENDHFRDLRTPAV